MRPSIEHFYKGGLWIKGLNGILELIGAALIAIATERVQQGIVSFLTQHDLGRGGSDRIYGLLARGFAHLAGDTRGFAILYLASHGVVKIVLAVLLLRHVRAAFPVGVAIFSFLIAYEVYRLVLRPGILISAVVLVDTTILGLILVHGQNHSPQSMPPASML